MKIQLLAAGALLFILAGLALLAYAAFLFNYPLGLLVLGFYSLLVAWAFVAKIKSIIRRETAEAMEKMRAEAEANARPPVGKGAAS